MTIVEANNEQRGIEQLDGSLPLFEEQEVGDLRSRWQKIQGNCG